MQLISVIIPCHNPRRDYLERVLQHLEAQTLSRVRWELLVIDNGSEPALTGSVDLAWHPYGRVVREDTLGLTPARLRGFNEGRGELFVMVDDDNLLAADYLERVIEIAEANPFLGVFGGSIEPEFESPPPTWTRPHWGRVAIRPAARSVWSNDIDHWDSTPSGAGMCVRPEVAERYASELSVSTLRRVLDRTGGCLVSGGDTDLAWTACAMGLGMGIFKELVVTHLIPPERLTAAYLARMYEGKGYSGVMLNSLWDRRDPNAQYEGVANLLKQGLRRLVGDWRARRFLAAKRRGEAKARETLRRVNPSERARDPQP